MVIARNCIFIGIEDFYEKAAEGETQQEDYFHNKQKLSKKSVIAHKPACDHTEKRGESVK